MNIFNFFHKKQGHYDLGQKNKMIEKEFSRARRFNFPITLISFNFSNNVPSQHSNTNSSLGRSIQDSFDKKEIEKYGRMIEGIIREFDQIIRVDDQDQLIILCPETDEVQVAGLVGRIKKEIILPASVLKSLDIVSFPKDGPTFRSLLSLLSKKRNDPEKLLVSGYLET